MRVLILFAALALMAGPASAHDFERTQIAITFARDGAFTLDVTNDPSWLLLRLESFARRADLHPSTDARSALSEVEGQVGPYTSQQRDRRLRELAPVFIDRVVLFVDRHEVRPDSAEYLPERSTYRLRGRLPAEARTLQWFYGLVIDPYPLLISYPDGPAKVLVVDGANWSGPIDLAGRFEAPLLSENTRQYLGFFLIGGAFLYVAWARAISIMTREGRCL
jgi:hypothetical protein